ncbi:MAG: DUF3943 domain-containing protein [Treponema sp.]|nr:DUF3943 domain-containing protein [Treponema sp.]
MKEKLTFFLLVIFLSNSLIFAQTENSLSSDSDSSDNSNNSEITFSSENISSDLNEGKSEGGFFHENDGKKHPFVALGGMLFFNLGLSSYNRWVLGSGWAQTSWEDEWSCFWKRKLEYDRDWYWTNFVLHPYQGGIYYQMARNSNLNKIESFGVTFLGSYIWEFFCETNAPSINDMFYTTVGSFSMGEMLYRLSLNADEVSMLFSHLINPSRLWTDLWLRQHPQGTHRNIHELSLKFGIGSARTYTNAINNSDYSYAQSEIFPAFFDASIFVVYNDPYGHDSNDPYSQFELEIEGSAGKGSGKGSKCNYESLDEKLMYRIKIMSDGMLFARAPQLSENTDTTLGFVMEYEFDWHQFYELSALGPGLAIKQRLRFEDSKLEWQLHGAWNAMGTTDYYYYHRKLGFIEDFSGTARNYNMATGPMAILKIRYITEKGSGFNFNFRGYGMYDYYSQLQDEVPGSSSGWEWIGVANASFEIPLSKTIRMGLGDEFYAKRTFYKKMPDIFQFINSANIFAKVQLK